MENFSQSCQKFNNSILYELDSCSSLEKTNPTTWLYVAQVVAACFSAIITFSKYNSINILNLSIHIDAISNTWWIIYYVIGSLRAVLNSIKYGLEKAKTSDKMINNFVAADWSIKVFELLILCFALNYQRKYRSTTRINEEIDRYSKSEKKRKSASSCRYLTKALASSGTVLCTFALVTWISLFLLELFKNKSDSNMRLFFWIFVGCCSMLHLAVLWLAILITIRSSAEGPSLLTKIFLIIAVLSTLPVDIPAPIWRNCVYRECLFYRFTLFDIFVALKVFSYLFFVLAMRLEYLRLKQECQWAMLNEVQRFSF